MKPILCVAIAALSLSACGPAIGLATAGSVFAKGDDRLRQLEAGYAQAKALMDLFVPALPDAQRAAVEAAQGRMEQLLRQARTSIDAADRADALAVAADELARLGTSTGR